MGGGVALFSDQQLRSRKGPKCYYCHKFGHIQKYCEEHILENKEKYTKEKAFKAKKKQLDSDCSDRESSGLVVCHALSVRHSDSWIVDSGATCHLRNNEGLFVNFQSLEEPLEVTVGDGHPLKTTGRVNTPSAEVLRLVNSDVCGKMGTQSLTGAAYFLTFIDNKTHYVWMHALKNKHKVFSRFQEWKAQVEKSTGCTLKTLQSDNGGEFTSNEFSSFLKTEGVRHEFTVPKYPEQE